MNFLRHRAFRSLATSAALILLCFQTSCHRNAPSATDPVRVAIIGGFMTTGMWEDVTSEFTGRPAFPWRW